MCIENKKTKFEKLKSKSLTSWRVDFVIIIFTLVLAYKLLGMDFSNIEIDIPTLLSICLAFFAIWLSIVFYFKADEANNRFYHHTYEFTKQTSEILGRLESGFGEKLDGVKENMKYFSKSNPEIKAETEKLQRELKNAKNKEDSLKNELKEAEDKINLSINNIKFKDNEKQELLNQINNLKTLNNKLRNNQSKINTLEKEDRFSSKIMVNFLQFMIGELSLEKVVQLFKSNEKDIIFDFFIHFYKRYPNLILFKNINNLNSLQMIFYKNFDKIHFCLSENF